MTWLHIGLLALALILIGGMTALGRRLRSVERRIQLGPAKSLRQDIAKVSIGTSEASVERLLGPPDDRGAEEWVYVYSLHAGYRIVFDANRRVVAIRESIG